MNNEIKKRIEQINSGQVPEGYKKEHGFIAPKKWDIPTINKIVKATSRPVDKPKEGYWRLGIRSHAKGTFHTFVENPETVAMDELYKVKENDLVLNITFAWEHAIAVANKEDEGKLVSHRFPTYEFKPDSVAGFYKYVIVQPRLREMLCNISPGGAGRNRVLNKTDFLKLNIPKPPKTEQHNIAEILSNCDRVIELKENLLTEKQNQKTWLMQRLLTSEIRLKGFSGEWKETKLGKIATVIMGQSPDSSCYNSKNEGLPLIQGNADCKNRKTLPRFFTTHITKECEINDIIITVRAPAGYISMSGHKACIGRGVAAIRPKQSVKYLFQYLLLEEKNWCKLSQGSTFDSINSDDIKNLKIKMPKETEQEAIAEILSTADKGIDLLQKEIDEYKQLKKSLMQLLLTGVVRVNELEINNKPHKEQEVQAC
ncbi:MAG: restriction endonuclease subunit S [Candidatus Gastranaerophilales bacterium]|nr:restriction endonuclease subunit S [Candidatus Gastranaerophilales bacterium]